MVNHTAPSPHRVKYWLAGDPRPKDRPRLGQGKVYTPQQTVEQENQHGWKFKAGARGVRFPKPKLVGVELTFYMGKTRPDLDNLVKLVLDGLNKVAYDDDIQVAQIIAERRLAQAPDQVGTAVEVYEMEWVLK